MLTTQQYLDYINSEIKNINYPAEPRGLYAPIEYTLDCGGKRIRPLLTLATCDAIGGNFRNAINAALAIEMFHNFTLLHDDVMDKADVRRGRPTVHIKWDEATAILSGDAMLTMATKMVKKCSSAEYADKALSLFLDTAMEVYEGQQYDMDFEKREDVAVEEYIEMIRLKTSVLLGCACKMGAVMAGAEDMEQTAFYNFGVKLGLAFQLQDDYLDTFGDPAVFGKKIGGDILNDKKTWLLISALNEDKSGRVCGLLGDTNAPEEKIEIVRNVYKELGLDVRCRELIDKYADSAIDELKSLELSDEAMSFFIALTDASRSRTH